MHFGNCTEQSPHDCETVRPEPVLQFCWHASLPACLLHPSCTCVAAVLVSIELSFAVLFCSFSMRCTALKLHCLMLSANLCCQPNETCFLLLFPATAASLLLLQGLSADMLATDLAEYLVRKGVPFR